VTTCDRCGRVFDSERTLALHFEYGFKAGPSNGSSVSSPEDSAARFPERAVCGNDQQLQGRGLVNHAWQSTTGVRDNFWTDGPA
jgi:hypothetical protein